MRSSKSSKSLKYSKRKIKSICYDLKLGSGCNSDKDLSKSEEEDQLVKYKDTEMYLHYIFP